jgi:TfoX N-terminal domain
MAYRERLAERIRDYFKLRKGVEEKRMFGGLCFMLNGHMCCGIEKDRLIERGLRKFGQCDKWSPGLTNATRWW